MPRAYRRRAETPDAPASGPRRTGRPLKVDVKARAAASELDALARALVTYEATPGAEEAALVRGLLATTREAVADLEGALEQFDAPAEVLATVAALALKLAWPQAATLPADAAALRLLGAAYEAHHGW